MKRPFSVSLLSKLREAFGEAADFEAVCIGELNGREVYLCYLSTLIGSDHFRFQIEWMERPELDTVLESFSGSKFTSGTFAACERSVCSGKTVLCLSDSAAGIILETGHTQSSGVHSPQTENVIRGPMYAFNENYQTNAALLRQRLKTSRLKIWESTVGDISRTKVGVFYMEGITDAGLVRQFCEKIAAIRIDGIQDTGELLKLLNSNAGLYLYPVALSSERPDRAAAALLNGKVVVILDGTPFSLIAPAAFVDFWHSDEDHYLSPFVAFFLRGLRFTALVVNLFLPAYYVALTSVNVDINRLEISLAAAASREGVPYPVFIETMLMLFILDFIVEAGVRLPKSISSTVTMVGGVVLGQAVIQANIVSNLLVIVAATTAITNFIVVDYQMGLIQRILKYFMLTGAGIAGVLGIVICFACLVIVLSRIESFGVSFLTPLGPGARNRSKAINAGGSPHRYSLRSLVYSWKERRPKT
ncbi:spore germination protein [Paenibacillus chitinolyticus]|uniref:spore germination protein n=1 Tax=Paenibacillus chitinolyticus TaxID=79263 RepID=UPI00386E9A23